MRQTRSFLLIPLAALGLAVAGCGGGGGSVPGGSIAKVGSDDITQPQFDKLMERAKKSYATNGQKFPKAGTPEYDRIKDQAVSFLVQRAEFAQEAQKMNITVTDKQVSDRLATIKKQYFNNNDKAYQKQLKDQDLTQAEVDSDIKDQLISQALYDKVTADVKVSDADVSKYYQAHITQYEQPESRSVRHILISVCGPSSPQGAKCLTDAKAKAKAQSLYDQLKAVPAAKRESTFASFAKKYSQDPGSASQGGKLLVTKGQFVAPFEQTAFLLGIGTISAPVKTQYGYHLIMPISQDTPAHTTPLKQVKASIQQQLLQTKKQEKMAKWVNDVKKDFKISYADGYKPAATSTSSTATGSTTQPVTTSAATTTTG
jgi:parvulin-like peptidyl-prolyl isomerase